MSNEYLYREQFLGAFFDPKTERNEVVTYKVPETTGGGKYFYEYPPGSSVVTNTIITNKEDIMIKLEVNDYKVTTEIDYKTIDRKTAAIVSSVFDDIVTSYFDGEELVEDQSYKDVFKSLIADNQACILKYKDKEGRLTLREVLPQEIRENANGSTTVIAHCLLRGDYRSFDIRRIIGLYLKI